MDPIKITIRFTELTYIMNSGNRFTGKGHVELVGRHSKFTPGDEVTYEGPIDLPACAPPVVYSVMEDDARAVAGEAAEGIATTEYDYTKTAQRTLFSSQATPKLLGLDLYTDRWGVIALMWEIYEHYQAPGSPALPDPIEAYYPGLLSAIYRGSKEVNNKGVVCGSIVYLNNQVQIWPAKHLTGAMPSDFYPVPPTDGYEAVIEAKRVEQETAAPRLFRSHLELALVDAPEMALTTIRAHALACGDCMDASVLVAIRALVTPWAMANATNNQLATRILGGDAGLLPNVLWVLGQDYRPL